MCLKCDSRLGIWNPGHQSWLYHFLPMFNFGQVREMGVIRMLRVGDEMRPCVVKYFACAEQ